MKHVLLIIVLCSLAGATAYTVKSSGGSFTTISACAASAVAGDSCTVFASASPQAGWTQSTSGSAGNLITFTVNPGDAVTVNSPVTLNSRSYIDIDHFTFTGSSAAIVGNGTTSHNIIDHNTFLGVIGFRINDGQGSNGSDNVISNNTLTYTSIATNATGFYVYGDRNRFENNTISGGGGDCWDVGGTNVIIRGNTCHDMDGTVSGEHIDFVDVIGGGTVPTLTFSLIENNITYNNTNQSHALIVRTGGSGTCPGSWSAGNMADTIIYRYNYAQNMDNGPNFGGIGDCVPNSSFYNNTIATERSSVNSSALCASYQNAPTSTALNNICYNVSIGGPFPIGGYNGCGITGQTGIGNGNLAFTTGYSGAWNGPYCGEPTYAVLRNQNPLFANYPTTDVLQATSPAKGAGVPLTTTVGSGSGSTALTVANAHNFQPGWAGAQADWIRIGASTTVQISSINYSTNVITLATPVSWTSGNSVYLYRNSSGTVVLTNPTPDVGAFQFSSSPSCLMPNPCVYNGTDVVSWTSAPNLGGAINNGQTVYDTSFLGSGCVGGVCHNFDGSAFTNSAFLSPITRLSDSHSAPGVANGTYVAGQGGSGVIVATNTNTSLVGFSGNGPEYVCLFNATTGHCAPIGTGIAIPTSFNTAGGGSATVGENFGSIFFSLTDPTVLYAFGTSTEITTPTTVTPYSINVSTGHYTVGFPTRNIAIADFQYGLPLGATNAPNWISNHTYHYGDYVTHALTVAEMAGGTGVRAPSTSYSLGDIITQNGTAAKCMYKVTVAGTSSPGAAPAFLSTGCKLDTFIDGSVTWRGTASLAQFSYQNVGANGVLSNASAFQWIHSPAVLSTNTCSMPLNSAVLTCTNAPFTAAMVGQTISVTGAGASGGVLYATILTYTSSTVVSLAFPATTVASTTGASLTGHPDLLSQVVDANGLLWTNVGPNYVPTIGSQAWEAAAGVSRDTSYPGTTYTSKFGMAVSTNSYGTNYPSGGYVKYSADQDSGIWAMEYDAVLNIYHLLNTGTGIWTDWSCSGGTGYNCSGGTWTPSVVGTLTNIANPAGVTVVPGISTQACPYYIHNEKMSKNGNHEVLTTHVVYTACNPLQNFEVWQPLTSVFPFSALNSLQLTFFGLNHWDVGTDKIMAFSPSGYGSGTFIGIYDASNASTQANFSTFLKPNVNLTPPPYPQGCHTVAGTNPDCTLADVLDSHLAVTGDHGNDLFPACGTTYNYKTLGPAINAWQNKETCYPVTPSFNTTQANSVNPVWQFSNDFNTHTSSTFATQFSVSEYSQDANWLFWGSDWNCTLGSSTGSAPTVWASGTHVGFLAVTAVPASPSSLCGRPWASTAAYQVGNMINPIEGTGGSGAIDDVFQAIHVNGTTGPPSSLSGLQPKCGSVSCFTATAPPTTLSAGGTVCDNQNYNGTTQLNSLNPALPYSTSCPNGVVWQDLGSQTGRGDVFVVKLGSNGGSPNLAVQPVCSPGTGTYTVTQSVTCTDASVGAIMCYTTNGSTPSTNGTTGCTVGTKYTTAISIAASSTLNVIAGGTGFLDSSIASYVYTINPIAATPVCSPVAGTYSSAQTVSCTDGSVGARMCFTTNGVTPSTNGGTGCTVGSLYVGSITVAISETLKAIAGGTGYTDGSVASYAYVINFPTAATPTFSPVAGTYAPTQSVTISSTSAGSIICWNTTGAPATNGITGCTTGTKYTGPVSVGVSETLFAVAGGSGYVDSSVGSAAYVIKLPTATPVCSPGAGSYTSAQSVSCTDASAGAVMCYTTNGVTPVTNGASACTTGTLYSGAITISGSLTLKVVAGGTAYIDGPVLSNAYVINFPTVAATPSCSPVGGTYTTTQSVTCTDSSAGAIMCYTTNGTSPATNGASGCTTGTLYSGAISVATSETLKLIAGGTSYVDSAIASNTYAINPIAATPSCSPIAGTYSSTQSVTCTDASGGAIMCYTTNGTIPATNGTTGCGPGTVYSGAINIAVTETLKIIAGGTGFTDGSIASYAYVINPIAATPSCSPVGGTYTTTQSVTCTDSSGGAVMCYTVNGSTPSTNGTTGCTVGTLYSGAISVASSETLKVIAGGTNLTDGSIASYTYTISPVAATPSCSPGAGTYASTQSVTCTDASGGAIMCYTTSGATPSTNGVSGCATGTLYSGAISIAISETLKVVGGGTGFTDGSVLSDAYVITAPTAAATPSCSPAGGTYTTSQSITCTDSSVGAVMCYTTNGTAPVTNGVSGCTTGTLYSTAISVAVSETVKVIAGGSGYLDSSIATNAYLINPVAATPVCAPGAGTYTSVQSVTCTDSSGGSVICYTTSGSTPATNGASGCTTGTLYSGAISVAGSETLKAIAGGTGYTDGSIASYAYTINLPTTAATPSCSPVGGTYTVSQSVSCTDGSAGSVMCYTVNGSTPATNGVSACTTGTLYSTAISIATTETLKVIAGGTSYLDSLIATNAYVISPVAAIPTCSPVAGAYPSAQMVTCTDVSSGAIICFTTNGSTPATNGTSGCATGTLYSGPITVSASQTIKLIAGGTAYTDGTVASYTFVINGLPVAPATQLFARLRRGGGIQLNWLPPSPQPGVTVKTYGVWRGSSPTLPIPTKIATVAGTSYLDKHCRATCCYEITVNDIVTGLPVVSDPSNIACASN